MFIRPRPAFRPRCLAVLVVLVGGSMTQAVSAQEPPPKTQDAPPRPEEATLPPVVVTAPPPVSASAEVFLPGRGFELRPQGRPADVLRLVPGLVIRQHQGGGKAPQYFLRGFDADHGTDVAVFVDGLPVNLVSHAHGQGYADLNFLIPETVERIELYKGPYFVEYGDLANAGAINLVTKDEVMANSVQALGGYFNTTRYAVAASPRVGPVKTLLAAEGYYSDGPFISPNRYCRYKLFIQFNGEPTPGAQLSL